MLQGRGSSHGIARLRDGVSFEQAYSEMRTIMSQLEKEVPQRNTNWSITLVPIHEQTVDQIRPALYVLGGAALLVLLIACVNVANLLLARSTVRQRELGLRTALGAARGRLLRQMLTESVLLSLAGGIAGLLLAVAFHRGLLTLVANRIPVPRLDQVALDTPVVLFTLALSLVTGLIFGVVPALFATGNANDVLREGGRHGSGPRARRALGTLVVAEVALSLVLLAGAGLLIRSFIALQNVNPGMRTEGVLTGRVALSGQRYDTDQKLGGFFTDVLARIAAIPGVENAAAVSFLPLQGLGIGTGFYRLDRPVPEPGTEAGHRCEAGDAKLLQDHGDTAEGGTRLQRRGYRRLAEGRDRQRGPGAAAIPERGSDRQADRHRHRPPARSLRSGDRRRGRRHHDGQSRRQHR